MSSSTFEMSECITQATSGAPRSHEQQSGMIVVTSNTCDLLQSVAVACVARAMHPFRMIPLTECKGARKQVKLHRAM